MLGVPVATGDGGRGKAGLTDRRDDRRRIGEARRVAHLRRLGGKIDAALDARQAIDDLLDARRTGRAAHAGNAQFEHLRRHVETRLADGGKDVGRGGAIRSGRHAGLFGGEIDPRLHARQAVQHFLEAHGAGRAAHAGNRQIVAHASLVAHDRAPSRPAVKQRNRRWQKAFSWLQPLNKEREERKNQKWQTTPFHNALPRLGVFTNP